MLQKISLYLLLNLPLLTLILAQEPDQKILQNYTISFESPDSLKIWKGDKHSHLQRIQENQDFLLQWNTSKTKTSLYTTKIPKEWTSFKTLEFTLFNPQKQPIWIEIHADEKESKKGFWRRVELKGQQWQTIQIPLYAFRRFNNPSWKQINHLKILMRDIGQLYLKTIQWIASDTETRIEPEMLLCIRAYGSTESIHIFKRKHFRIFSNISLDGEKLLDYLDQLLVFFKEAFALDQDPEYPITLVLFKDREAYIQFCLNTATEVYAVELNTPQSDGHTLFDYSASSFSEKFKENRPVYVHEAAHQLVSRYLGFDLTQSWIQEGIATLCQQKIYKISVSSGVKQMLQKKTYIPLKQLDALFRPKPLEYLQMLTLIEFLRNGEEKAKFQEMLVAFRNLSSLEQATQNVLKMDLELFEKKWLAFCLQEYP